MNDRLHAWYHAFFGELVTSRHSSRRRSSVKDHYLLLQDRIEEAIAPFRLRDPAHHDPK